MNNLKVFVSIGILFVSGSGAVGAKINRTWVASSGDNANTCGRSDPCRKFGGAISKTVAGGGIDAIDPGDYGAVTITKRLLSTEVEVRLRASW